MVAALAKKKSAFAKAASIPARRQSENAGPRLFGLIFLTLPLIAKIFSNFSSSALKRHLLKRRLTLSENFTIPRHGGNRSNFSSCALKRHLLKRPLTLSENFTSGGRGCLGEGRLGLPDQVWEFRFLPSFPSFPRESRSPKNVWENAWKSQTSFFQTSAAF